MITIGLMMRMQFIKDPEGHGSNVIIKAFYYDKVWVQHEQSGVDDITDTDMKQKIADSLNRYPQMKDLRSIEKWNGALPTYMTQGSVTPFVSFK